MDEEQEELICPDCKSTNISINNGYATCCNCLYSWRLDDSMEEPDYLENDPYNEHDEIQFANSWKYEEA